MGTAAITIQKSTLPQLVGIVNITPDSFSDGGNTMAPEAAFYHIERLIEEGAAIIDIGAESTRPGAVPMLPAEEWERLAPALPEVIHRWGDRVTISVDTRHAATAEKALAVGAHWINDVSGGESEPLLEAVAAFPDAHYVLMHSLGAPVSKAQYLPVDSDPIALLIDFAKKRLDLLEKKGIRRERIVFDPGIGFGKTPSQNWQIIRQIAALKILDLPLFVGHSRKSFLAEIAPQPSLRDAATLGVSFALAVAGVAYLRIHDVAGHKQAFTAWQGCRDV